MRSRGIDLRQIDRHEQHLFAIHTGFSQNLPARATHKTLPPKFQPIAAERLFSTDTIDRGHITSIRHRMTAVTNFPRRMLISAVRLLL